MSSPGRAAWSAAPAVLSGDRLRDGLNKLFLVFMFGKGAEKEILKVFFLFF